MVQTSGRPLADSCCATARPRSSKRVLLDVSTGPVTVSVITVLLVAAMMFAVRSGTPSRPCEAVVSSTCGVLTSVLSNSPSSPFQERTWNGHPDKGPASVICSPVTAVTLTSLVSPSGS